jgi:pimeloyl-ACP methyl ester carboxylesterase
MATATITPGALPADPPPIKGVTHRYADAGGVRIHYAEAGDGPPVLLLHGWPQHHYMWRKVIEELRGTYRLIAPDLRGFGWSEAPGHGYDGDTFARDQIALLDALDIEKAHVIGHDWGGWTTFLLGLRYPERLGRLMVCNAPHPWPRMSPRTAISQLPRAWYGALVASPGIGRHLHMKTDFIIRALKGSSPRGTFDDAELKLYADSFRAPERAAAAVSLYRYYLSLSERGLRGKGVGDEGRLKPPTLLLFGEKDMAISTRLVRDGWQDHADDMSVELADAGHFIVNEKPELVVAHARAHLG